MCTRYVLLKEHLREILAKLGLDAEPDFASRYNVTPGSQLPAVRPRARSSGRELATLRWGLVPAWAKSDDAGTKLVNARRETVAEKPSFREALTRRRCAIPASGFYEWKTVGRIKQPLLVRRADERPFCFPGLWESWRAPDGSTLETFAIVTTEPNELMRPIHTRMPIMFTPEQCEPWLDPAITRPDQVLALLTPQPAGVMSATPVSRYVSQVRHEGPACFAPPGADDETDGGPQLSLGF